MHDGGIKFEENSLWHKHDEIEWRKSHTGKIDNPIELKELPDWIPVPTFTSTLDNLRKHHLRVPNFKICSGHTGEITSLKMAGGFLFSASENGTIKKWNVETQECVQTIQIGKSISNMLILEPYIFGVANNHQQSKIYQFNFSGECLHQIEIPYYCESLKILGSLLFCFCKGSKENRIEIYDCYNKKHIKSFNIQNIETVKLAGKSLSFFANNQIITWDFSHLS